MQLRSILHLVFFFLVFFNVMDWIAWGIAVDRETLMLCLGHHFNYVDTRQNHR